MIGQHLYEDDDWRFILFQPLGVVGVVVVFHDASATVHTAACNLVGSFVDIFSFGVEHPNKSEVDKFVHWEVGDSAYVLSSYGGAHSVAELDNFPAVEKVHRCLLVRRKSIDDNCLQVTLTTFLSGRHIGVAIWRVDGRRFRVLIA